MIEEDSAFPVEGNCVDYKDFPEPHLDLFKDSWCCVLRRRNWDLIKRQGQDTKPSPKPSRLSSWGVRLIRKFLKFTWSKL